MLFIFIIALILLLLQNNSNYFPMEFKHKLVVALLLLPLSMMGQNVWERPDDTSQQQEQAAKEKQEKPNPDAKYLEGAVPEVNGKIEWSMEVDVPGKSATQIYDIMLKCFTDLTKTDNQLEGSSVALVNKQEHIIVANIYEWLVFKDISLSLDRAKMRYALVAYCSDGKLKVTMSRISYKYEEERVKGGIFYKAEDWISDKKALNRKHTRLLPGSAKFRRKTIDRKDYLFGIIKQTVLK